MKDELIGGLFFAGGFGVLVTYTLLYITGAISEMAKVFDPMSWRFWSFSMVITTAAVLGVYSYYSFEERMEDWKRDLLIASTCLFLGGAMLWSVSIIYMKKHNVHPSVERIPLILTALGTIGLLVAVANSTDNWLLLTAVAIIAFHHVVFDAMIWANMHEKSKIMTI